MATNINQELFKRYSPKKKLGLINGLGQSELLATAPETIKRIAKETGRRYIGMEIDPEYYKIALNRLNGITADGQLSIFTDISKIGEV